MSFASRHARKFTGLGCLVALTFVVWFGTVFSMGMARSSREVVIIVKRVEVNNEGMLYFQYEIKNWLSSGVLRVIQRTGGSENVDRCPVNRDIFRRNSRQQATGINVDDPQKIAFHVKNGDVIRLEIGEPRTIAEGWRIGDDFKQEKYEMTIRFD